jgi:hypothetical protein
MSEETTGTSAAKREGEETDHDGDYNDNDTGVDEATASAAALIVAIMATSSKAAFRSTGDEKERVVALASRVADSYPAVPVMLAALMGKFDGTEINPTVRSHNLQSQSV